MPESKCLQKHHKRETSAYQVMHRRCLQPRNKDYPRYGGAGILICPQWLHNWHQFIRDMGPAPSPDHWLGRRDVKLGYTPENCIWTLPTPQKRRRAYCHKVTLGGQTMTVAEAGRLPGQPTRNSVLRRMKAGFSLQAPKLAKLYCQSRWLTWQGETLPLPEWARRLGLPHSILWARLKRGMPLDQVMHPARFPRYRFPSSKTQPISKPQPLQSE